MTPSNDSPSSVLRLPGFSSAEENLNRAYATACGDLAGNIVVRQGGLLTTPRPIIAAGLRYPELWTRDASVNAWNAGSFVAPAAAQDGLMAVVERRGAGYTFPHPDYYDSVIWIIGAWHHACVTGDRDFLHLTFEIARDALARFRREEYDATTGLYRGGSFFNDGVAGYPAHYATQRGSNILDWLKDNPLRAPVGGGLPMQCLSTNCLHVLGLEAAAGMASALGAKAETDWSQQARDLREAIRRNFWDADAGRLRYLVDSQGVDDRQEIGGWAFACLAGVLDSTEQARLARQIEHLNYGTPSLWPTYERYVAARGLGRHSGLVWPHVLAFWGDACARRADEAGLAREARCLAEAAMRHGNFTECWHPLGGQPDGGLQEANANEPECGSIRSWESMHRTTWGATGFLRLMLHGIAGLRVRWDGLALEPCLPEGAGPVRIERLYWRGLELSISLEGAGSRIASAIVNGTPVQRLDFSAAETGKREIAVVLAR